MDPSARGISHWAQKVKKKGLPQSLLWQFIAERASQNSSKMTPKRVPEGESISSRFQTVLVSNRLQILKLRCLGARASNHDPKKTQNVKNLVFKDITAIRTGFWGCDSNRAISNRCEPMAIRIAANRERRFETSKCNRGFSNDFQTMLKRVGKNSLRSDSWNGCRTVFQQCFTARLGEVLPRRIVSMCPAIMGAMLWGHFFLRVLCHVQNDCKFGRMRGPNSLGVPGSWYFPRFLIPYRPKNTMSRDP